MLEKEPDSTFSHSACQLVLEKKAESLKTKRNRLADPCLSHNNTPTNKLFPMEPHRSKRGMFHGQFNQRVHKSSRQQKSNVSSNVVIQGLSWEKFHPGILLQKPTATATAKHKQQQQQKKQGAKPWHQKRSWRKQDEEER